MHQIIGALARFFAMIQHLINLFDDRHFNAFFFCQIVNDLSGTHPFNGFGIVFPKGFGIIGTADFISCLKIAGMNAGTGNDQIPDTGQSHKGFEFSAHRRTKTDHLCQTTRDQCRFGIVAVSDSA